MQPAQFECRDGCINAANVHSGVHVCNKIYLWRRYFTDVLEISLIWICDYEKKWENSHGDIIRDVIGPVFQPVSG
jgi:hypothetical protein